MDSPSRVIYHNSKKEIFTQRFSCTYPKKQIFWVEEKISHTFLKKFVMLFGKKQIFKIIKNKPIFQTKNLSNLSELT